MRYIARTLLYDKRLVERPDPETGALHQVETGYVAVGDPIELDPERAEILLAQGDIEPAPEATAPTADPALASPDA